MTARRGITTPAPRPHMSAVGISPCRLFSSRKSLDGVRPGWLVPSSEWPSICVELSPCPATQCALGNPGEKASQPHMLGSAVLSQSTRKLGRHPNHLCLKIHLRASFPGCCLFVIRLLQSAGPHEATGKHCARRNAETSISFYFVESVWFAKRINKVSRHGRPPPKGRLFQFESRPYGRWGRPSTSFF